MRIDVDKLTVRRGTATLLDGVSFSVESGQHLGIIGPNGSGKSTLLRCLYRSLAPTGGTLRVDGRELSTISRREAAQLLAAVTQFDAHHLGYTVAETVRLGRFAHGDGHTESASQLCREAMVQTSIDALADCAVTQLSGGERQRVHIARALAQDTPALLLDEPLNHLDVRHQVDLLRYLRGTKQTIVMALHDVNLAARSCEVLLLLRAGKVLACGPPQEVLTSEMLTELYGVQPRIGPGGEQHVFFDF